MLETDPRLSCQHLEDHLPSIIANTNQCPIYKYSDTLAYKPVCRKRETKLMAVADDITLPIVSKVGVVDDVSSQWYQKGAIIKLGYPLDVKKILPAERLSIAQHMAALVASLHEKGIIHGDIKPENFVRRSKDECLRLVDFSSARMADGSDLITWPSDTPSVEYSSPDRRQKTRPSTPTDDKFALAVSIWAVFAGEKPMVDLFNSNQGHMPDLTKIEDDDMFCAVVDFLKEGGLRVDCPGTLARRDTLGIDRAVSFPLSLFDADLDEEDGGAAKKKPRFCPHCFQIAMSNVGEANGAEPEPPVYPEFCHLRTATHVEEAVSEYALRWLQVQESVTEGVTLKKPLPKPSSEPVSCDKTLAQKPMLQVNTMANGEIEKPLWSATSSATVIAPKYNMGRDRSGTVVKTPLPAPSESDEGYGSMECERGSSVSPQPEPEGSSFQRTMSHWSESSLGSCSDDDGEELEDEAGLEQEWLPWPQTPMPTRPMRMQTTSSFESVALTDDSKRTV